VCRVVCLMQSLSSLGMGLLDALILVFPRVFWNHEAHRIGIIRSSPDDKGLFQGTPQSAP
jgi:hypothetical protein